jgi:hypothetical protein
LGRYGRVLLENLPEETTQLLIDICTGSGFEEDASDEKAENDTIKNSGGAGGPSYLSYLAYNRNTAAVGGDTASITASTIKEKDKDKGKETAAVAVSTSAPDVQRGHRKRDSMAVNSNYSGSRGPSPPPAIPAKSKPPAPKQSPRIYFVHFIDHPEHFVRFLEAVAFSRWGQRIDLAAGALELKKVVQPDTTDPIASADAEADKQDRAAVWNTLIELYLTLSSRYLTQSPIDPEHSKEMKSKALIVLKSNFEYDPTHALLVCSTRQFTDGQILLWEKLGMYEDILRYWMDKEKASASLGENVKTNERPSAEALRYLKRYGETNPQLYPLMLRFLTSTPVLLQRHTTELTGILEHIEEQKIMPPLAVVQVLSRNGVASVGLVKQWLMRRIGESKNEIDSVCIFLSRSQKLFN